MCPRHAFISSFVFSKFVSIFLPSSSCCWLLFLLYRLSDSLITQSGLCVCVRVCVCVCMCVRANQPDSHGMGTFNHFKIGSRSAGVSLTKRPKCNSDTSRSLKILYKPLSIVLGYC